MYTHYQPNQMLIRWTIYRGVSTCREDFRHSYVETFIFTKRNKIYVPCHEDAGTLTLQIPEGLATGVYSLLAIWTKNEGRSLQRAIADDVLAVSEFANEATNGDGTTDATPLNVKSSAGTFGYDGLSAYELAVLKGMTVKSEDEWVRSAVATAEDEDERKTAEQSRETAETLRTEAEEARATNFSRLELDMEEAISHNLDSLEQTVASEVSGGTNVITATFNDGTEQMFHIKNGDRGEKGEKGDQGEKGEQGNSGYSGAAEELEVVNNLTDGGAVKALSAEMGKTLDAAVSQVSEKVGGFELQWSPGYYTTGVAGKDDGTHAAHASFVCTSCDVANIRGRQLDVNLATSSTAKVMFFDQDDNLIISLSSNATAGFLNEVTVPPDAVTLKVSNDLRVVSSGYYVKYGGLAQRLDDAEKRLVKIDGEIGSWLPGYYYTYNDATLPDGTLKASSSQSAFHADVSQLAGQYIEVYCYIGSSARCMFLDADGQPISYLNMSTTVNWVMQIPEGATSFRCSNNKTQVPEPFVRIVNPTTLLPGRKMAIMGDSITSTYISKVGDCVNAFLGTSLTANFAVGSATISDYSVGGQDQTVVSFDANPIGEPEKNTLSNQVRRLLQKTTPQGEQITWTHPIDGTFTIPAADGTGTGEASEPDIIYMALGINDAKLYGRCMPATLDDAAVEDILSQTYSSLDRMNLVSGLRWALETLQCAYPNAQIFVATPLQCYQTLTDGTDRNRKGREAAALIRKTVETVGAYLIDAHAESGFTRLVAVGNGEVHPNSTWRGKIARYVAQQIRTRYVERHESSNYGL